MRVTKYKSAGIGLPIRRILSLRRLLFLISIALIFVGCSAAIRQVNKSYPNQRQNEQWTEIKDSTGRYIKEGKYFSLYESGEDLTTGEYHNDKKSGLWVTKFKNGRLKEWHDFVAGQHDGLSVGYFLNRNKKFEGKYIRGLKESSWRRWYENGNILEIKNYNHDLLHGLTTDYYESGQKRGEANYSKGILDGPYTSWRENGLRWSEGFHSNGKKIGNWTTWNDMGIVTSRETYSDGELVETTKKSSDK